MGSVRIAAVFGVCVALASCATPTVLPYAPLGPTQQLIVNTDPAGASCAVLQDGAVVGSVEATPGTVAVRRDFCPQPFHFWSTPDYCTGPFELIMPIEVRCRKEGYLDLQRKFQVTLRGVVQSEEGPQSSPTAASQGASGLAVLGMAAGPYGVVILAPIALAAAIEQSGQPPLYAYAYRSLPTFFLVPESFASRSECDAFFATLQSKLEAERDAKRAYIDRQCRFFPCEASDPAPCPDPVCVRRRVAVDAELKTRIEEMLEQRVRACVAPR